MLSSVCLRPDAMGKQKLAKCVLSRDIILADLGTESCFSNLFVVRTKQDGGSRLKQYHNDFHTIDAFLLH